MNINQLNQNEYVDKSKEWTKNIEDVANKAEDMLPKLEKEPDRSQFIKEVSNSLIAVNSEEQQLVAEKATVKPTTAEWNKVAKRDVTQVEKTQLWTGLNTEVETWVDVA